MVNVNERKFDSLFSLHKGKGMLQGQDMPSSSRN